MQAAVMNQHFSAATRVASEVENEKAHRQKSRLAYVLSAMVALSAATISIIGIAFPSIYRGNWGSGTSIGNDLVTLVVAVPTLSFAIVYSVRGSIRATLLWLGALYYMFYNYAFYVFGIPVTKLYLPIIVTFALAGLSLALGMGSLDIGTIAARFSPRTPGKPIAVYLSLAAVMVSILWCKPWIKFLLTGRVPDVNGSEYAYQVIAAVDLSFMVPLLILAACLLWMRRPWGYVLGAMMSLQGAVYNAVMGTVCVFNWRLTGAKLFSDWFVSCLVGVSLCLLCVCALVLGVRKVQTTTSLNAT
jgi:hypothetical protein